MIPTLTVPSSTARRTRVFAADTLVCMGTERYYPPVYYFDSAGQIKGLDINMDIALCAAMGAICDRVTPYWDGIIQALNANTIITYMSINTVRAKVVSFTDPCCFNTARFVAQTDIGPTAAMPEDLKGMIVGAWSGTLEVTILGDAIPDTKVKLYPKLDNALLDLKTGCGTGLRPDGRFCR